jgi:DNA-binding Xre family transcriptional regulator
MTQKKISMASLASKTGLSIETIRRARGKKIDLCKLLTLKKIAIALDVNIENLFDE